MGKCMPFVPGTATVWQLPATCGVQNYYLVPKFAIYPLMCIIWWAMYLSEAWKCLRITGRTFTEILADPQGDDVTDRPTYEKCLKIHGLQADIKNAECEAKGEVRSYFLAAHDLWCSTVQYYQAKTQKYDRNLYATASGRVTSSRKCCSNYMLPSFLVAASVTFCGASWPTSVVG